jgi:hypothetical protein
MAAKATHRSQWPRELWACAQTQLAHSAWPYLWRTSTAHASPLGTNSVKNNNAIRHQASTRRLTATLPLTTSSTKPHLLPRLFISLHSQAYMLLAPWIATSLHWLNKKYKHLYTYATGLKNNGSHRPPWKATRATLLPAQTTWMIKLRPLPPWQ